MLTIDDVKDTNRVFNSDECSEENISEIIEGCIENLQDENVFYNTIVVKKIITRDLIFKYVKEKGLFDGLKDARLEYDRTIKNRDGSKRKIHVKRSYDDIVNDILYDVVQELVYKHKNDIEESTRNNENIDEEDDDLPEYPRDVQKCKGCGGEDCCCCEIYHGL